MAVVVLACVAAVWFIEYSPILNPPNPLVEADGITLRQVWSGPEVDTLGQPSPDGRYLSFVDWETGDLALRDLVTEQNRRLTNKGTWFESLEFAMASVPSPDGKEVAYAWYNKDSFYDLRIVGLDGSKPRVLYRDAELEFVQPTDWSPDGKKILATCWKRDSSTCQIVLVSAADGSLRVLKAFDAPPLGRFSPDGRYIAYDFPQRNDAREHDIFLLAVDGGREIPLVQHPANDVAPEWTPDGKRILFGSDRAGTMGAWWIEIAEGNPQGNPELVKPDLGRDRWSMGFTRDGSYYYAVRTGMSDVHIAELDLATGKLLAAPTLATQRFVGSNSKPDWSPDGRQLLYLSKRGPGSWGARTLYVRSTESGEVRELASKLDTVTWVRWSPDARSLLAGGRHSDESGLYRIDVETGNFERVARGMTWAGFWSHDGKAIFYYRPEGKRIQLLVRDLKTGQEKELHSVAEPSHFLPGAALSRDGQRLAFMVAEAESASSVLKVIPAAGGEVRELLRESRRLMGRTVAWAPDGLSLLFSKRPTPADSKTELWQISVQGGEPRKLEFTAENMRDLCVHPDGRRIAFTAGQDQSEVWVMEDLFPEP